MNLLSFSKLKKKIIIIIKRKELILIYKEKQISELKAKKTMKK